MTSEEKAVLDAAMAWLGARFSSLHDASADLRTAILDLAKSRVSPELEQEYKAKLRAEREASRALTKISEGIPFPILEPWYDEVAEEEKRNV